MKRPGNRKEYRQKESPTWLEHGESSKKRERRGGRVGKASSGPSLMAGAKNSFLRAMGNFRGSNRGNVLSTFSRGRQGEIESQGNTAQVSGIYVLSQGPEAVHSTWVSDLLVQLPHSESQVQSLNQALMPPVGQPSYYPSSLF